MSLLVLGSPEDGRGVPQHGHGYTLDDQYLIYHANIIDVPIPYYRGKEVIYTWKESEVINGKPYMIVYDAFAYPVYNYKIFKLHMRREASQIRVIYDEYKQFMHDTRGRDMSDFDSQCPYEVIDDGEMVLYDFDMQPGDKFRSVEGKEDVYVVRKEKMAYYILTDLKNPQGLLLSNGVFIMDNVGAAYHNGSWTDHVDVDFFDYVHPNRGIRSRSLDYAQLGATRLYDDLSDGSQTGISTLPADVQSNHEKGIFDLSGRALKSTPSPGVYIRNGKKFIVK